MSQTTVFHSTPIPVAKRNRLRLGAIYIASGLFLLLGSTSCSLMRVNTSDPKAQVGSLTKKGPAQLVSLTVLQSQVMRFADVYASMVAQAADDFSERVGTPQARLFALRWKLGQATSVFIDATGVNPALNALDTLVLVTMARMVIEDYGVATFGDAIQPLLETQRHLEAEAWLLANGVLKPAQQMEVKQLISEWRAKHPDQHYVGFIRFSEFVIALGKMPQQKTVAPTSVFSLLFIDPLAGLDPTAAAIEETRRLGERAMFYTQRMPTLLSWQTEVLAYQLANQPETKEILSTSARLANASESFAKTAEQIPALINEQRQQIVEALTSEEQKASSLLNEARQTFASGSQMAVAVNAAIQSLDQFVHFVTATNTSAVADPTNSKPFNVLDYGQAAGQVGVAAGELQALLNSVNQSAPQVARFSQQTTADASRLVQHAFMLGLILIAVLLIGSVLAALSYRILVGKITRSHQSLSSSSVTSVPSENR